MSAGTATFGMGKRYHKTMNGGGGSTLHPGNRANGTVVLCGSVGTPKVLTREAGSQAEDHR